MNALNTTERERLTSLRSEIVAGDRHEFLTRRERDRLGFHRWLCWQLKQCPCGYDWDGCRCVTDPADEIAH
jgi:hypothetical protein